MDENLTISELLLAKNHKVALEKFQKEFFVAFDDKACIAISAFPTLAYNKAYSLTTKNLMIEVRQITKYVYNITLFWCDAEHDNVPIESLQYKWDDQNEVATYVQTHPIDNTSIFGFVNRHEFYETFYTLIDRFK